VTRAVELKGVSRGYLVRNRFSDRFLALFGKVRQDAVYWALRDVSLSIASGETFGLIGENGAGKSTLLKIVAGTLRPSCGEAVIRGRVAALLELGAGFHPEQSGWDNIRLMGALAGIPAEDTSRYIREVAEFSELSDEILARPVKTYSSGMFMRLAFSAATNVDPDVLIVDEALSVGDLHFQKKSLDRILAFREQGKTVLFCSHNLYQVRSLCTRVAWLDRGRLRQVGDTETVVSAFESYEREKNTGFREMVPGTPFFRNSGKVREAPVRLEYVALEDLEGKVISRLASFQGCRVVVDIAAESSEAPPCHLGVVIVRNDRENIFGTATHFLPEAVPLTIRDRRRIALTFPSLPLLSGDYLLSVYVLDDSGLQVYDQAELVCPFTVIGQGRECGLVYIDHRWEL